MPSSLYGSKHVRISFKQKTVAKVVQVYISKLNTEMIDRLRQVYFPSTEIAGRYRKISGRHTKGHACLIGEKAYHKNRNQFITAILKDLSSFTFLHLVEARSTKNKL